MILAADPGKRTGLARYEPGRLSTATIDGDDIDVIVAVLTEFARECRAQPMLRGVHEGTVVIEDQYAAVHVDANGQRQINVKSVIKLVERRTLLVAVARTLGLRVELVKPATWQGPCFKSVPRFDEAGEPLDTKTRAGLFVAQRVTEVGRGHVPGAGGKRRVVPASKLPKDERDAAAIALYWATWGATG